MARFIKGTTFSFLALALASPALAQTRSQVWGGPLTQEAQTVYVSGTTGTTTYDSEAAGSKETKVDNSYTVGGWAGEGREVGASITSSDTEVPFSLNNSSMRTSFRDVRVMARLGWLIPFATVSLNEIDITQNNEQTVGLYGTGAGGGLAVGVPLHEKLVLQAEAGTVTSTKVYDKLDKNTKLGRRDDADAHLSFDITDRIVDLLVGYKARRYQIETPDQKYLEQSQGAYAGLRLGLYF